MQKANIDELTGSKRGAAMTKCSPNQGGSINFYLIDEKKENIENLIMEYNNLSK